VTRFKFMSFMVLLAIASAGFPASQHTANAFCTQKAGPPSGLCVGTDTALDCSGCDQWWPKSGLKWSNSATRSPDVGTGQVASYVVTCKTLTPCNSVPMIGTKCEFILSVCARSPFDVCTPSIPGTPVVTTDTTYYTVPCPPGE